MGRKSREDEPGMWHHVFNRGLAHRAVFESRFVARFFLSRVACAVRRGEIQVHAFVLMTTHFHLLVRSPNGQLSVALQRIESQFVRWFNVVMGRDGALFRGRFGSKPVKDDAYRSILIRYIDQNPVVAGLAETPEDYRWGSASRFLSGQVPPWLATDWIDAGLARFVAAGMAWADAYRITYSGRNLSADGRFVVERRMEPKTRSANGAGFPIVGPASVATALAEAHTARPDWPVGHNKIDPWRLAEVGLLRNLCGMKLQEIGHRMRRGVTTVKTAHDRHLSLCTTVPAYATRFANIAAAAVACFRRQEF